LNSAEPITAMSKTAAGMNREIIGAPPGLVDQRAAEAGSVAKVVEIQSGVISGL
jgi:hypothetical protein